MVESSRRQTLCNVEQEIQVVRALIGTRSACSLWDPLLSFLMSCMAFYGYWLLFLAIAHYETSKHIQDTADSYPASHLWGISDTLDSSPQALF